MDATEKLTNRTAQALKYEGRVEDGREVERHVVWDSEKSELGLRVYPSGAKSWVMRYRFRGRKRLMKLGRFPSMTADVARSRLKDELAKVYKDRDPLEEKRQERVKTVGQAWQHFSDTTMRGMREGTRANYEGTWRKHLKKWSGRTISAITKHEVEKLYADLAAKSVYAANDTIRLFRRLCGIAGVEDPSAQADFGVKGKKKGTLKPEKKRTRYLDADELKRLADSLDVEEDQDFADFVRLLLVTGARPFEWRMAEWDWVNFRRGVLRIPREVSKIEPDEDEEERELSPAALQLLKRIQKRQEPKSRFIFPQSGGEKPRHRNWPTKPWERVAKRAKLKKATLYTLRHTFGTWSLEQGLSLPATAALMGHRVTETTLRYAHAMKGKEAATRVSGAIEAAMRGEEEEAEVVEHPSAKRA